jgi:hypothetical protein
MGSDRPYRVTFGYYGTSARRFATFAEALAFERKHRNFSDTAIINDDRAEGGKRQGLTEEEYLEWIG